MKKEYKTPVMKVVAVRTERLMNDGSIGIFSTQTDGVAWSKEDLDDEDLW